ncbi:flagellar filament capping protein FliD [Thiomicrospira microaerophila]|uniref:flagellar filament capping protein FliD n=1 Tax=Thiomicrospira microaerophila TaxID=406020 RepID=UPI002010836B|nr:flagellar filament capping protein FliD [Thiomicrospira microaerophila]UQB42719.1 flagellar filament capping protein FliD [Thiomicrospira microaerophila]
MSNEIGSALVNRLSNSGIDANNMAKVLAEAEVAGPRSIIDRAEKRILEEKSGLTYLKANLEAFNSYTKDLADASLFNKFSVSSSNDSVLSASLTGQVVPGTYNFMVQELAKSHTIVANQKFASPSSAIDQGTLNINIAGQPHSITIDASNASLEGLQRSINGGDYGITASIVNVGGQYQMMFSSKNTGEANEFTISGLNGFDSPGDFNITSQARDAEIEFNGLPIKSATNTFDEVISGLSFQVKSEQPGVNQTITVNRDTEGAMEAVKDFVFVYNQLTEIFKDVSSYEKLSKEEREKPENEFTGLLAGSSLVRELRSQIRESLSGAIDGLTGAYQSLADIGITLDMKGVMSLDESRFSTALTADSESVSRLFAKGGYAADSSINVLGGSDQTRAGSYALEITQLARRASVMGDSVVNPTNVVLDPGAEFNIKVDQATDVIINLTAGSYTLSELAQLMQTAINNNSTVAASGGRVSVGVDGDRLSFTSERFGGNSVIELSGFLGMDNAGLTADLTDAGQNVDGTLTMSNGSTLNIGAYADQQDGRKVKVSSFAFAGSEPAEVRGLEFEVLGGAIGSRGTIDFTQGFASRLFETINNNITKDDGLVSQRLESLDMRNERLEERREKIDARYEKLEMKYRLQFSMLQSILSGMDQTRSFLDATYNRPRER